MPTRSRSAARKAVPSPPRRRWRSLAVIACTATTTLLLMLAAPSEGFDFNLARRRTPPTGGGSAAIPGLAVAGGEAGPLEEARGRPRRALRNLVPISTSVVIGTFSVLEILEGAREVVGRRLGHAHGVSVLAVIRLSRSLAILQTQAEEFEEQVEEIQEKMGIESDSGEQTTTMIGAARRLSSGIVSRIGKAISAPVVVILACIFAIVASVLEIVEDVRPGAHHGAALLALSETIYQIRRFVRFRRRDDGASTSVATKARFPVGSVLGTLVALAAAGYAAFELYEDFRPGAHHGVAVLALAELVENVNRAQIIR